MERMQKQAVALNIQLRFAKSSPPPPSRSDVGKKNRAIKRHIAEKVGIVVKPFSLTTPSDVDAAAANTKTIVKPDFAPLLDIKEPAKNTKLLLERAQERIKKLMERRNLQKLRSQSDSNEIESMTTTTASAFFKQLEKIKMPFQFPLSSPSSLSSSSSSSAKPFSFADTAVKQPKKRQANQFNLFGAGGSVLRPIDFVPAPVRQFVPNVIPDMVMGRPPLATSSRNNEEIAAAQKPPPQPPRGMIFLPQFAGFQIAAPPAITL